MYCFRPARTRKTYDNTPAGTDAQKKFGNAKAISSDQYFGKNDMDVSTAMLARHLCYMFIILFIVSEFEENGTGRYLFKSSIS